MSQPFSFLNFFLFPWFCSFFPSSVLLCFTQRFSCVFKDWKLTPNHIKFNRKSEIFDIKWGQVGSEETFPKEERREKEREFTLFPREFFSFNQHFPFTKIWVLQTDTHAQTIFDTLPCNILYSLYNILYFSLPNDQFSRTSWGSNSS